MEALVANLNLSSAASIVVIVALGVGFVTWRISKVINKIDNLEERLEEHEQHVCSHIKKLWEMIEENSKVIQFIRGKLSKGVNDD